MTKLYILTWRRVNRFTFLNIKLTRQWINIYYFSVSWTRFVDAFPQLTIHDLPTKVETRVCKFNGGQFSENCLHVPLLFRMSALTKLQVTLLAHFHARSSTLARTRHAISCTYAYMNNIPSYWHCSGKPCLGPSCSSAARPAPTLW